MYRKKSKCLMCVFILLWSFAFVNISCGAEAKKDPKAESGDLSFRLEVQHAIDRGLGWLAGEQKSEGYWSQSDYPALTALVLTGYMGEPAGRIKKDPPQAVTKGYEFLLSKVQPDGGIYTRDLANYNTALSLMALVMANDSAYEPVLRNARNFLVDLQWDFGEKGTLDTPLDGGIGYGGRYKHSDVVNTTFSLEALHYTKYLANDADKYAIELKKLNWEAALKFIERSQNLTSTNDQEWASDDSANKGGFVYFPGNSKAGEMTLPSGKVALRSYGSISYTGLLSFIYANLKYDDPRVVGVMDWLRNNYTLDENPGLGQQGLYYYYHLMTKALAAYGEKYLVLADGTKIDWRKDLTLKLLNLQRGNGSWFNENGRWWEKDPVLVSSYAIISLEILYQGL